MKRVLILPIAMVLSLLLSGCCDCDWRFTEEEKDRIADISKGDMMRVLTVENDSDLQALRSQSKPVSKQMVNDPAFEFLCVRMLHTVQNPENSGVGLAAPQVGIMRRLILVQRTDKEGEPFEFYVNPMIVSYSEEIQSGIEGCLSIPGKWGIVDRARSVKISYQDPKSYKTVIETVEGFTAVIFQHEIDHLDGILYPDKGEMLTEQQLEQMREQSESSGGQSEQPTR